MQSRIKVLIVDDSAVVRQTLREVLESDPQIEVTGAAPDPYIAVNHITRDKPDVITLDVEMPRMDGLTFLSRIMNQFPIPVVMCSSVTTQGCETSIRALELGAVDIIAKPSLGVKDFLSDSRKQICQTIKDASRARVRKLLVIAPPTPKLKVDAMISSDQVPVHIRTTEKLVVVGASTGGTEALRVFLERLPIDSPGVVVVQHMPEKFTASFAERLNTYCAISVKEARDGDSILRGTALIAPGGKHTLVHRRGATYYVEVKDGPLICRHKPSVDVLFKSAALYAGGNAVGVIMTGMGDDGADGMLELKTSGAFTIAQDENTSVVFGMPREAIARGAVQTVLPLEKIPGEVVRACA